MSHPPLTIHLDNLLVSCVLFSTNRRLELASSRGLLLLRRVAPPSSLEVVDFFFRDRVCCVLARVSPGHRAAWTVWAWRGPCHLPAEVASAIGILAVGAQWRVLVEVPGFVWKPPRGQARVAPLSCDEAAIHTGSSEGDVPVSEGEDFQWRQRHRSRGGCTRAAALL